MVFGYALMLIAMSFNIWLIGAIIIGYMSGYWLIEGLLEHRNNNTKGKMHDGVCS